MLTLTLDGNPVDLPADAEIALSYRSSDLRRLDTREAAFSETFPYPSTPPPQLLWCSKQGIYTT